MAADLMDVTDILVKTAEKSVERISLSKDLEGFCIRVVCESENWELSSGVYKDQASADRAAKKFMKRRDDIKAYGEKR